MRYWILAVGFCSVAQAADVEMTYQGRAVDAMGTPITGDLTVQVSIHTGISGGTQVWSDEFLNVPVEDGYFTVILGSEDALDSGLLQGATFVRAVVGSADMGLQQLTAVPHAVVAETLSGGIVTDALGHREWSDGTYATSCEGYLRPSGAHHYAGDTGDGVYRIDPNGGADTDAFDAWCDMSTDGGGWTLLLRTNGDSTFGYDSAIWTSAGAVNDATVTTASGNSKYAAFDQLSVSEMRGCFVDDDFCFSLELGGRTALETFSGPSYVTGVGYRVKGAWRMQPNCRYFGINTPYTASRARFGFTANQESNCTSNDTGIGFGTGNTSGTAAYAHGAAEMCLSSNCIPFNGAGGDITINRPVHGLLWGR